MRMFAKRVEGLVVQRAANELLAVRESTGEAHALNETAAIVFDLCDGETSPAVMATEVTRRTGLPTDEAIVQLALGELAESGLVILPAPPAAVYTRRAIMRQLSLSAAMVAALPVVESILLGARTANAAPVPSQSSPYPSSTPTPTPTATTQGRGKPADRPPTDPSGNPPGRPSDRGRGRGNRN